MIQYLSHQLNETQQRWPIIEKEAYAIIYSIQKFRHYLYGSKFTVMTDHKTLKHLFTSPMLNSRIQRWAIILEEYGCDVEYISGLRNVVADALSRLGSTGENMASESYVESPANYASQTKEGVNRRSAEVSDVEAVRGRVNVIDSDLAPGVQLQSEIEECGKQEQRSKEKFREFLEDHSDFQRVQSEDSEVQQIVRVLGDPNHSSYPEMSRYYCLRG